jgi:formamidopyrimidine-DNA glycosylase
MPELPEVETIARDLRRHGAEGRTITAAFISWPRAVRGMTPGMFARQIVGKRIAAIGRRAKYLIFELSDGWTLLVHLRMTGRMDMGCATEAKDHVRIELELDDGRSIRFHDCRKFGRWTLTREPGTLLNHLGPEPLGREFTPQNFRGRLEFHRRRLKPLLLDQTFLAGMGNIYADEALWEARLHPQRQADTLSEAEALRLHAAVRLVLRRGIARSGTSLGKGRSNFRSVGGLMGHNQNRLKVFRKTGEPCPRCGTPIARMVVAQRGTHICPECQPSPRR